MQAGNLLLPPLWKAASLESGWVDVPAARFQHQLHKTGFHPNVGFLFPVEWAMAELWMKAVIKSFGLVDELLIRKNRCFWPYIV